MSKISNQKQTKDLKNLKDKTTPLTKDQLTKIKGGTTGNEESDIG